MLGEDDFKKAPVYLQIREAIYNKIINGEYKADERLPAEDKLAELYGVSRMTVNKALAELVNKEYLTRIQGSGTFVSKMRKEGSSAKGMSFNDSLTQKGFKVQTIVLEKQVVSPNKHIAELLRIPVTSQILYLKRLRKVHGEPIVVQEAYLTRHVSDTLVGIDFTEQSLYASLEKYCSIKIARAKDTVEAKAAEGEVCELLEVKEGFPVLVSQRVAFDTKEVPIEVSYSIYRSDQYVLEVEYR